jgi:hypothetical protein
LENRRWFPLGQEEPTPSLQFLKKATHVIEESHDTCYKWIMGWRGKGEE